MLKKCFTCNISHEWMDDVKGTSTDRSKGGGKELIRFLVTLSLFQST